jgi:hypothetical protein
VAAVDILRQFAPVQPLGATVTAREFVDSQQRMQQAIAALVKFNQTVMPTGSLLIHPGLTAVQVDSYFDASLRGKVGYPFEGWEIADDLDGRFIRLSASAAGTTGGSDSSAHTHSVTSNVSVADHAAHTHTTPAHSHSGTGLYAMMNSKLSNEIVGRFASSVLSAWTATYKWVTTSGASDSTASNTTGLQVGGSTANDGSGTSGNPSATLTHTVTNNAVTSGAASATDNRPAYYEAVPLRRL